MITADEIDNMFSEESEVEIFCLSRSEYGPNNIPEKSLSIKRYVITRIMNIFGNNMLSFWYIQRDGEEGLAMAQDCNLFTDIDSCISELRRRIKIIKA